MVLTKNEANGKANARGCSSPLASWGSSKLSGPGEEPSGEMELLPLRAGPAQCHGL